LAVGPDGRYAYAINSQTKDVTVVDTATGKSQGTIGGGGYALEALSGGRFLFVVSGSELRLIHPEKNTKAGEISLPDLRGLFFSKDRSVAIALAKQAVLVLDGANGKELARLADLARPAAIGVESFRSPPCPDGRPGRPRKRGSVSRDVRGHGEPGSVAPGPDVRVAAGT